MPPRVSEAETRRPPPSSVTPAAPSEATVGIWTVAAPRTVSAVVLVPSRASRPPPSTVREPAPEIWSATVKAASGAIAASVPAFSVSGPASVCAPRATVREASPAAGANVTAAPSSV